MTKLFKLIAILVLTIGSAAGAQAFSMSSTNYKVDDGTLNSFGGAASSTNYGLTSSGGEPFIGAGSSTNYKFNAGYVAQLEHSISLTLDTLAVTIPAVTPGTSQTATSTTTVYTDAAGYLLAVREDKDLTHTDGLTTIPAISPGTITTPVLWTEGTTKGFSFTLTAGTGLDPKWGSTPNFKYAAFPADSTTAHDKAGYSNSNNTTTIQYRLDVSATQKPGTYRNNVTYSATVKP